MTQEKIVSQPATYLPCWISYTGAIGGVLQALGNKVDISDVGGQSGYAFLLNVTKETTCPSGPTGFSEAVWSEIQEGTEDLGWKLEHYTDTAVAGEQEPTPEEYARLQQLFEKIRQSIDTTNRPVVLWGLVIPEYGIVNGYKGNAYQVSTFRALGEQPDDPIPFFELTAPGCLDAYFFREPVTSGSQAAARAALDRAIRFAKGTIPVLPRYVAGSAALKEWARVLEEVPEKDQLYHGNSYVGACYCESLAMCAEFLPRLGKQAPKEAGKPLETATKSYAQGAALLKQFTNIFPFSFKGDMPVKKRKKGATLLRQVVSQVEKAVANMEVALKLWE